MPTSENRAPEITVAICAYNAERYLAQTLESVANQTFKDWEVLIIDDGSKDSTASIVRDFERRGYPVRYHYQENRGFGFSRNKSLELARGRWVAIIDHDDICMPRRLEMQWRAAQANPQVEFIFADSEHFTDEGKILLRQFDGPFQPYRWDLRKGLAAQRLLLHGNFIGSETAFFLREKAVKIGGFDERYRYITDYDFFVRFGFEADLIAMPDVLARWRVHPRQITQSAQELVMTEHIQFYEKWRKDPRVDLPARRALGAHEMISNIKTALFYARRQRWSKLIDHGRRAMKLIPESGNSTVWALERLNQKLRRKAVL